MIRAYSSRGCSLLALALGAGLAGCNASPSPMASIQPIEQPAAGPQAAPEITLPAGAACTGAIQRWRAVIEHDYRTGYVDPPVYAAAERDIAKAQPVCAAGHDAEAVRMVQASRHRHGYPPD